MATQYKAHSLIRHLQSGWNFFRQERNESFDILPASQRVADGAWYAGTADAVTSNCVINLAPDKAVVFREAARVLRPGGRMVIADIVLDGDLPDVVREDVEAWVGCIAGAMPRGEYFIIVRERSPFGYGTAFRGEITVGADGAELLDAVLVRGGTVVVQDSTGLDGPVEAIGDSFGVALTMGADGEACFANVPPGRWVFAKAGRRREVLVRQNDQHFVKL